MNEYLKQAEDFLKKTSTTLEIVFSHHGKYFDDDKDTRDVYNCTLKRGSRSYTFTFGNSVNNSGFKIGRRSFTRNQLNGIVKKDNSLDWFAFARKYYHATPEERKNYKKPEAPNAYDILACLEKYEHETFEDFCGEFGYDTDSRKAEKVYKSCQDQYLKLCGLFSDDEMGELREIQ